MLCRLVSIIVIYQTISTLYAQETPSNYFDLNHISEIRLKIAEKGWDALLDSLRIYNHGMLVVDATIDGKAYKGVGLKYRGTKSYQTGMKRNPMSIQLNHTDKSVNHEGYTSVKLSSALRDPSMVREVLSYEIARKYMVAPKCNFTRLYINDSYWGLYVNIEPVEEKFLETNFGSHTNLLYKCAPDVGVVKAPASCKQNLYCALVNEPKEECYTPFYDIESSNGTYQPLMELTQLLNKDANNVHKVLDIDRTLWMLAYNNVLVNLSSYTGQNSQNYFLYKDNNGKFVPIIWDLNLSFGSFKNTGKGSDLKLKELQQLDPLLHIQNNNKPLISKLLQIEDYKKVYVAHLRAIVQENFQNNAYEKRAKELQKMIKPHFVADPNKDYSEDDFNKSLTSTIGKVTKIPGIVELMRERTNFLKKSAALVVLPPEVKKVDVMNRKKFETDINSFMITAMVDKKPKKVKICYRYNSTAPFMETWMADDGAHNDKREGDGLYGVVIKPEGSADMLEYYIVAENPAAISYYPSNYMYTPLKTTLAELNK